MKKIRIPLIVQICIGVFFVISLLKQEVHREKLTHINNTMLIQEYCNSTKISYKINNTFLKVNKQKNNIKCKDSEFLVKSKREKVLVTDEYIGE